MLIDLVEYENLCKKMMEKYGEKSVPPPPSAPDIGRAYTPKEERAVADNRRLAKMIYEAVKNDR